MADIVRKSVFITGSSRGIGKAAVKYFQKKGWNVAATMRNPELESELNALERVRLYRLDVCDQETIDRAVTAAIRDFGRIDVLVNNAGCLGVGPFEAATKEQIQAVFQTNVFGLMDVTRAILPHFRANRDGAIVNISSLGGLIPGPLLTIYDATKLAVDAFSDSLRYELQPYNIRIKVIEPSFIKTNIWREKPILFRSPLLDRYYSFSDDVINHYIDTIEAGSDPDAVAKVIYKAAREKSRKLIYPAGKQGRFMIFLKTILPNAWWFALEAKTFPIPKEVKIAKVLPQEAPSQEWAGEERRRMERQKVDILCDVTGLSHGKEISEKAHVANISPEGMYVEATTSLDADSEAAIKTIKFGETFWIKGKVVRNTGKGMAIRFTEKAPREIEHLLNTQRG